MSDIQKTEILQKSLLEYLVYGSESDPALLVSGEMYFVDHIFRSFCVLLS